MKPKYLPDSPIQERKDWKDLARQFRALQPRGKSGLRAMYEGDRKRKAPEWFLCDPPSESVRDGFIEAAKEGAWMAGCKPSMESWLELLREGTEAFRLTPAAMIYRGTDGGILQVCGVSGDYCMKRSRGVVPKKSSHASGHIRTTLGRNIEQLRKECGWTYEQLAEKMKLEKSSVIRHISQGSQPRPANLKNYGELFSKTLGRKITVTDLERNS